MAVNAKYLIAFLKHKLCLPKLGNEVYYVKFNIFKSWDSKLRFELF